MAWRTAQRVLAPAAAAVDLAVRRMTLSRTGGQRMAASLGHEERLSLLAEFAEQYRERGAFEHFFRSARPIQPELELRLQRPGLRIVDVHWPSDYLAFLPEMQHAMERVEPNRTATARLVLHDEPRPVAILIHGYLGGVHRTERRVWPMQFFHRIGMDVALFVLPFHGPRARRRLGGRPPFPGADPRVTNEGFRQAMGDLSDFVHWLLREHPAAGVMGMSLGGFSSALAATVEPKLSFAIPIIPLASIADVARLNRHLGHDPQKAAAQYRALDAVYAVTSPLHRTPLLSPHAMLIVAAEQDRITPIQQAKKLADHFGCKLETMPGGHLVQLGRADQFRNIGRFLNGLGLIRRR